jgi:cytoskeleton protein RodZ
VPPSAAASPSAPNHAETVTATATKPAPPMTPPPVPQGVTPAPPQIAAVVPAPPTISAPPPSQAAPAAATVTPAAPAAADPPSRILLRATADSWIQVRDAHQAIRFSKLLHAGDTYRVPDEPGLVLRTGNAAGLAISVDGKALPPASGGRVRSVALDPARLLAGTAFSPASASE